MATELARTFLDVVPAELQSRLEARMNALCLEAQKIQVHDAETQEAAWEWSGRVKAYLAQVDAAIDDEIDRRHHLHKNAVALKKFFYRPDELRKLVNAKIAAYRAEQQQIRQAEERRLSELARREAEDRLLAVALDLERQGRKDEAANVLTAPVAPIVVQLPPVAKPEGAKSRTDWKFRIADPTHLPREYLMPDEVKIGGVVRSLKGATQIPGVEVFPVETVF